MHILFWGVVMFNKLYYWQTAGFLFTSIFGVLLHFLFEWTNGSKLAALISGVNESTWEHMKLLFFPLFIFSLVQYSFFKDYTPFFCVKLKGVLLGLLLIPVIFYTLRGVFGNTPDWLNISIFFFSAAAVFLFETLLFKNTTVKKNGTFCFVLILAIGVLFAIFTFYPPKLPLFLDAIEHYYGIKKTP